MSDKPECPHSTPVHDWLADMAADLGMPPAPQRRCLPCYGPATEDEMAEMRAWRAELVYRVEESNAKREPSDRKARSSTQRR